MIYIGSQDGQRIVLATSLQLVETSHDVFYLRQNGNYVDLGTFTGKDMAFQIMKEIKSAIKNGDKFYQIPSLKELLEVYKKWDF